MTLSVIIPTMNRPVTLADTLRTVLQQTREPDQVVIMDQSNGEETGTLIHNIKLDECASGHSKPEFTYVYRRGLCGAGAARNLAIEHATGDVLVFLDDDVLLEREFFEEMIAVYDRDPSIGGVSGVITNYTQPGWRQRLLEEMFCLGPFHDARREIYWNADRLRNAALIPLRKFGAGLSSIRRVALGTDRFDPFYKGAGAEDVDLSWRVSERWPLVIAPRARLVHVRTETGRPREHWLSEAVKQHCYLYHRLWDFGIRNRLCFAWLKVGYGVLVTVSCLRRRSLAPLRALLAGVAASRELLFSQPDPRRVPA